jgi:exopolysaccharide biosynthesis polyprenyl glycosylphosphotransferase
MTAEIGATDRDVGVAGRPLVGRQRRAASSAGQSAGTDTPAAVLRRYRTLALTSDFLAAAVAAACAALVRFGTAPGSTYVLLSLLAPALWVLAIGLRRGYEDRFLGTGPEEYRSLADATLVMFIVIAVADFTLKSDLSRGFIVGFLPLTFVGTLFGRRRLRGWLYRKRLAGHGMHHVLVVGRSDTVSDLLEQFEREPAHGLVPVGACVSGGTLDPVSSGRISVSPGTDPRTVLRAVDDLHADVVAVAANPDLSGHALRRLAWQLDERGVDLILSPGIVEVAGPRLSIRPMAGLSLLHMERPATRGGRMLVKRILDRLLGITLFVALLPLLAVIAIAIRRSSPGPVLFRQIRIGEDGRPFEMLKFRSMVVDAEDRRAELEPNDEGNGVLFKIREDPRVTRVGALLRRYSLDELPQLWNVVRGDMSLVGPRPPLPQEVIGYSDDAIRRLRVRPGMTGLWQVSGRSDLTWEESLRLDLRYVDNWSLALDATILWRTWRAVLGRSGAY